MGTLFIWVTTIAIVWSTINYSIAEEIAATSSLPQIESGTNPDEYDNDSARKIIGSRVVTSVSVIMNGQEPQFTDAVGNYIPRPLVPPRVASPVSLLDPDRYEFYTFNDDGDLVKRLMTMEEIQGIVANGDSDQQVLAKTPTGGIDNNNNYYNNNEASIQDIVNNVQKVLSGEMASQNFTTNLMDNKLHTPDTSSSWSLILPAIFGNTGETILANNSLPVTTGSTADSIIIHTTSKKPISNNVSASTITKGTVPPKTTTTKLTKQKPKQKPKPKPKPSSTRPTLISTSYGTTSRPSSHSTTVQKNKQTSVKTQTIVKNTLAPENKIQNTQSITTFTPKPNKFVTVQKPSSLATKTSAAYIQKVSHGSSTIPAIVSNRITASASHTRPTKPISLAQTETYRPPTQSKVSSTVQIGLTPSILSTGYVTKSKIPETKPTKKNGIPKTTFATTTPTKKKTTPTKLKSKSTTPIPHSKYTTAKSSQDLSAVASTVQYVTVNAEPTTRKTLPPPIHPTTLAPKESPSPDLDIFEPEPDNLFDSELSLNQIIESLQNLEGTTMPYPQSMVPNFMDITTFEPNSLRPFEKLNTESVAVHNNGQDTTTQSYLENDLNFKQSMSSIVSYIPQTTSEYSSASPVTENYNRITANTKKTTDRTPLSKPYMTIQHKESDDDIESVLDEKTTTELNDITTTDINLSEKQVNGLDFLRESFDSVLSQVQNEDGMSTAKDGNEMETTTTSTKTTTLLATEESTKMPTIEKKKKVIVKPTPYILFDDLEAGTEPMSYLETVVKYYENEKNENEMKNNKKQNVIEKETEKKSEATESPMFMELNEMSTDLDSMATTTDEIFSNETPSTENLQTETVLDSTESNSEERVATTTEFSTEKMLDAESRTDSLVEIESDESMDSTTEAEVKMSTIDFIRDSTDKQELSSMRTFTEKNDDITFSTRANDLMQSTTILLEDDASSSTEAEKTVSTTDESTTVLFEIPNETDYENQANYEMVQLIEKIAKNLTGEERTTANSVERKDDANVNVTSNRNEIEFSDLGESSKPNVTSFVKVKPNRTLPTTTSKPTSTAKPTKWKLPTLAPILNNLKMKVVNALKMANTITLDPAPKQALGLEESTLNAGEDILEFSRFCNELAFNFWNVLNNDGGISSARSLVLSPFALTSMLSMLFLGARGRTSGEINDMLHLDDIVSFNPHAMFRNISESVDQKKNENVHTSAFVRELLSERSKGKILSFFKEKVQQFYSGYVEEVNFTTVNDIIRRRTNLLIKRYSSGKVNEYLKASNIWVKPPLSGISANIFETDCSKASKIERDGEMFFQVLPAIRQRRLVPIPAVVWKSGFTAGYDPELDATAVAIGLSKDTVSTIFVMPGQQGHSAPGDNLERLESVLMINAVSKNAWRRLLATLMVRNGLEVQIPRFTHRSFVNATSALRKLGLNTLFDSNEADLRGITGASAHDMYVSDLVQINTFSTCGEDKLSEEHHVEMYPAPPNKHRNIEYTTSSSSSSSSSSDRKSPAISNYESERAFAADPLFDLKYLNLPLPLRPRQARIPEVPRLRFDKPFIYFVRHNPTGMVLYFGRFNPRLLP